MTQLGKLWRFIRSPYCIIRSMQYYTMPDVHKSILKVTRIIIDKITDTNTITQWNKERHANLQYFR